MTLAREDTLPCPGDVLGGRYRLTERIGAGGMGRVYRARDELLARDVAVKLFYTDTADAADQQRRASEAQVLASLNHPSLVTLFDARVDGPDQAYLVMELIEGPTLQRRIENGPLPRSEVAGILRDLAEGLAAVHEAGIVHRDVKPSNVLLRPGLTRHTPPTAVLADFGVAHLIDAARLTTPGTVIGTAAYLAPEQVRGERSCAASDIYSLGLLTIEALTRLHPFGGGSLEATVLARLARQPDVPGDLGYAWKSLLSIMTAPDPAVRPTASEVALRASVLHTAEESVPVPLLRRDVRAASLDDDTAPLTAPTPEMALMALFDDDPDSEAESDPEVAPTDSDDLSATTALRWRGPWIWAAAAAATVAVVGGIGIASSSFGLAGTSNTTQTGVPAPVVASLAPVAETESTEQSGPIIAPVSDRSESETGLPATGSDTSPADTASSEAPAAPTPTSAVDAPTPSDVPGTGGAARGIPDESAKAGARGGQGPANGGAPGAGNGNKADGGHGNGGAGNGSGGNGSGGKGAENGKGHDKPKDGDSTS